MNIEDIKIGLRVTILHEGKLLCNTTIENVYRDDKRRQLEVYVNGDDNPVIVRGDMPVTTLRHQTQGWYTKRPEE